MNSTYQAIADMVSDVADHLNDGLDPDLAAFHLRTLAAILTDEKVAAEYAAAKEADDPPIEYRTVPLRITKLGS